MEGGGKGERSKLGVCNQFWLSERGERSRGFPHFPLWGNTLVRLPTMYTACTCTCIYKVYTMIYVICTHHDKETLRKCKLCMALPVLLVATATKW